jgi:hypothetical protein
MVPFDFLKNQLSNKFLIKMKPLRSKNHISLLWGVVV